MLKGGQGLLSGGVWSFGGKSVAAVGAILVNVFAARMLSPAEFGVFVLCMSLTMIGGIIAALGMHLGLIKIVAENIALNRAGLAVWAIQRSILITALSSFLLALFLYWGLNSAAIMTLFETKLLAGISVLLLLWLPLRSFQLVIGAGLRGLKNIRAATVFDTALSASLAVVFLAVYWWFSDAATLAGVALAVILALALTVLIGFLVLTKTAQQHPATETGKIKELLVISLPLLIVAIMLFGLSEIHLWLLAAYQPEEEVGLLGSAQQLVKFVSFPLLVVNAVLPPYVAALYSRSREKRLEQILRLSATLVALPSLIVLAVIISNAGSLMSGVFGQNYEAGSSALLILALAHGVNVVTGSPGILMAMSGHQMQLVIISFIASSFAVITSIIAIPGMGASGAALGAGIGIASHNVMLWLFVWSKLGIRTHLSISSLNFAYWRLRRYVSVKRFAKPGYLLLDTVLSKLETTWWRKTGKVVIQSLGDSHAQIFNELNRADSCLPQVRFKLCSVSGATAFGLANPNSSTNAMAVFSDTLKKTASNVPILFMLGEVDVGFLVHVRAAKQGITIDAAMLEALENYTAFLSENTGRFENVLVCSAPLPTIEDGQLQGEVAKLRQGVTATQLERTSLTLLYNKGLESWCAENNRIFLDLDQHSLDSATGLLRAEFLNSEKSDHHYDRSALCSLLKTAIHDSDLTKTFSQ